MPETTKKDNSLLYIISTISFIIAGIILTGIINKTTTSDIRSRASATDGVHATAIVSEVDPVANTVMVTGLVFVSSPQKDMGSWTVTLPSSSKLNAITVGTKVQITIDPATMRISDHALTAKEIKSR